MGKFKNKGVTQKQTTATLNLTRKQKRKDKRKDKKALKHNFFMKKHGKEITVTNEKNPEVMEKKDQSSKTHPGKRNSVCDFFFLSFLCNY